MLTIGETFATPPGGWRFTDPVSGMKFPVTTGSVATLRSILSEVATHRTATGGDLNPGWEERVVDLMCQQHPDYPCVHDVDPGMRSLRFSDVVRFLTVMAEHVSNGLETVSDEEANRRELICLRCPKRTSESFCAGCKSLKRTVESVVKHKQTKHAADIGSCHVCGCLLKVKLWMPLEVLGNDGLDYPPHCWLSPTANQHQDSADQDHTEAPPVESVERGG